MAAIIANRKITVTHLNIRQSIFLLLFKLILLDAFAAFLAIVFFSLLSTPFFSAEVRVYLLTFHFVYFLFLVIVKIFLTLYVVLYWLNEYYEIHPDKIVHRNGIIWRKEEQYPLRQIRLIKMEQGTLGKLCNYGTLELFDWDLNKYTMMYLIHNPQRYVEILEGLTPRAGHEKDVLREHLLREKEDE